MSGDAATERLYYTDARLREFSARVVDRADDGRRVYLDRTAFYPTSGGQPHDVGTLGGQRVVDVVDEDDRIAHVLEAPLDATEVKGVIDWTRRFDNMQQHTGQHLLSAVFDDLFKAKTVSVHFGDAYSTVDLETDSLSPQSVEKAERHANLIVAENRPVTVTFEDAAAASGLRKPSDRTGPLRIITIADTDRSACGGTHVRGTGEIGGILLRSTERTKKAIRVEFVCGLRAIARARADFQALTSISQSLSSSPDMAPAMVAAQSAQLKEGEKARRDLEKKLSVHEAEALFRDTEPLRNGIKVIMLTHTGTPDLDRWKLWAQALVEKPKTAFIAHAVNGQFVVAASEDTGVDVGKTVREALSGTAGKGGGSARMAQGTAPADAIQVILSVIGRDR